MSSMGTWGHYKYILESECIWGEQNCDETVQDSRKDVCKGSNPEKLILSVTRNHRPIAALVQCQAEHGTIIPDAPWQCEKQLTGNKYLRMGKWKKLYKLKYIWVQNNYVVLQ